MPGCHSFFHINKKRKEKHFHDSSQLCVILFNLHGLHSPFVTLECFFLFRQRKVRLSSDMIPGRFLIVRMEQSEEFSEHKHLLCFLI